MPKIIIQGGGGGGGFPLIYMGTWDANANVPFLASGVGVQGHFYIVSVAGTTNLDGITDWYVGDWAVFDGVVWQQIDNSENPVLWNVRLLPGNGAVGILDTVIEFTAAGTLALEAAPIRGRTLWLKRSYAGALYTVNGNGKLIEGKATLDMAFDGQSIMIVYDGASWKITAAFDVPHPAKTLTVSPPGFPMAADYPTITAAIAASVAGDLIDVYPGIYFEPYPLVPKFQTSLVAVGGSGVTFVRRSNAFLGNILTLPLDGLVKGFTFQGENVVQVGILGNVSQGNRVRNCRVVALDPVVGQAFLFANNSVNNVVEDCQIGGGMVRGVVLTGGSEVTVRRLAPDPLYPFVALSAVFEWGDTETLTVQCEDWRSSAPVATLFFNDVSANPIGGILHASYVVVQGQTTFLLNRRARVDLEACAAYLTSPAIPMVIVGGSLRMRGCDIPLDTSTFSIACTLDFDHGSKRTYAAGPGLQRIGNDVETAFFAPGAPGPQPVTLPSLADFGPPRLYAKDDIGVASVANPITLLGGLENIDGALFYNITRPYGWVILEANKTTGPPYSWRVVSEISGVVPGTTGAPITFGAGTVSDTITTRYLYPGYEEDLAQTIAVQYRIPRPGTLQKLRMRHNVVGADAGLIVYTVRINGVPTLLSVSLAANAADGADLVNSVAVVAGDLVDIRVTKAVALALGGPSDIAGSMELL